MKRSRRPRTKVHEEWAFLVDDDPVVYSATVVDLSDTGALIDVNTDLDIRSEITVCHSSQLDRRISQETILQHPQRFEAVVVRQDDESRYGVKFLKPKNQPQTWNKDKPFYHQIDLKGLTAYCSIRGMPNLVQFTKFCSLVDDVLDSTMFYILDFSDALKMPQTGSAILEDMVLRFTKKGRAVCMVNCENVCPQFAKERPENPLYEHFRSIEEGERKLQDDFSYTILIIDDGTNESTMLTANLQHLPIHLQTAQSIERAMRTIPTVNPDLILLDLPSVETDAIEFVRRIRQNEDRAAIPLVGLISGKEILQRLNAQNGRNQYFLLKPVRMDVLKSTIATALIHHASTIRS